MSSKAENDWALMAIREDIAIELRVGSGDNAAFKDADIPLIEHPLLLDGIIARRYSDISLRLSWVERPDGSRVFNARLTFNLMTESWCTAGLNRGVGYQIWDDGGRIILDIPPARIPEMQLPRSSYFIDRSFAINQSIFDQAALFSFIGAEDIMRRC